MKRGGEFGWDAETADWAVVGFSVLVAIVCLGMWIG